MNDNTNTTESILDMLSSEHIEQTMPSAKRSGFDAMYELARTYLLVHNYDEVIQCALVLADNVEAITRAEELLMHVIKTAEDSHWQEQAQQALVDLQEKKLAHAIEENERNALEKSSFLLQVEETIDSASR